MIGDSNVLFHWGDGTFAITGWGWVLVLVVLMFLVEMVKRT